MLGWVGCGFNDVGGSDAGFTTVAGRMQVYDDCRSDAGFGTMASPVHESLKTTGRSDSEFNDDDIRGSCGEGGGTLPLLIASEARGS